MSHADSGAEEPIRHAGWPPVPGDFVLGSHESPVAVCTLATQSLLQHLEGRSEIAIAGRVYTENVGIEKMVQNLLANARLRVLLVCGRESRHRVGQAILSLHRNGADPVTHRIRGATGPEPVVPNLAADEVAAFQQRFVVIDLIGEQDPERILERARSAPAGAPPTGASAEEIAGSLTTVRAEPDSTAAWTYDPLGFFLVQVDRSKGLLLVEHFDQDRVIRHRLDGDTAAALCQTAVRMGLLSDLNHAAYLGRELAKAETALRFDLRYQQDSPLRRA